MERVYSYNTGARIGFNKIISAAAAASNDDGSNN